MLLLSSLQYVDHIDCLMKPSKIQLWGGFLTPQHLKQETWSENLTFFACLHRDHYANKVSQKQKDGYNMDYLHGELGWGAWNDMIVAGALPGKRRTIRGKAHGGSENDQSTFMHMWKCYKEIQQVVQLTHTKVTSQQQKALCSCHYRGGFPLQWGGGSSGSMWRFLLFH